LITTAKSAPACPACRVSSIVSAALWWPVWASTGHFPRQHSTTTSTSRRRSAPDNVQNSLITPPQKTPSMLSSPVSRSRSRRSAASSSSPVAPNGVVVAAHRPVNRSLAACLASLGR
jgi:hypothetical protein